MYHVRVLVVFTGPAWLSSRRLTSGVLVEAAIDRHVEGSCFNGLRQLLNSNVHMSLFTRMINA